MEELQNAAGFGFQDGFHDQLSTAILRMMLRDNRTGDQRFKELMRDFVKTYAGKAGTTEDFQAMVEKHMTAEMDLEGNHKVDWFFNEYVYGTQLPAYKLDSSFDIGADGDVVLNMKLAQSGPTSTSECWSLCTWNWQMEICTFSAGRA